MLLMHRKKRKNVEAMFLCIEYENILFSGGFGFHETDRGYISSFLLLLYVVTVAKLVFC